MSFGVKGLRKFQNRIPSDAVEEETKEGVDTDLLIRTNTCYNFVLLNLHEMCLYLLSGPFKRRETSSTTERTIYVFG
jgi:hypothetical protein